VDGGDPHVEVRHVEVRHVEVRPAEVLRIEIRAQVLPDLATVEGVLRLAGEATLADPLAALPDPPSDLHALRTFPGPTDHGRIELTAAGPGAWRFVARLPERFGPYGATAHGAFANGGWYPQPLAGDGLPLAEWRVSLTLPPGVTGALGPAAGSGTLTFEGVADRVPLAVLPRAVSTPLRPGVSLLTARRPGRRLVREVTAALPPEGDGVVVRAPLRRRLTADGPGLVYLSDRAFRLTPGLESAHRRAVARGLAAGLSGLPDDFDRDLVGAVSAAPGSGMEGVFGAFRWVPQVNWLLVSQRIAFWSETTGQAWPADPVVDDLTELYAPHWPGAAAAAALADRHGPEAPGQVAAALRAGAPSPVPLDDLRRPPPVEDLALRVTPGAITVDRRAPATAPPAPVVVRVDDRDVPLAAGPGVTALALPSEARRVTLDPARHRPQTSRVGDAWPPRWDVTAAGWVDGVNLSQRQLWVGGQTTLRRTWDTHNLFLGSAYHSPSDLVAVRLGYLRKEGPLLDGIQRPLRLKLDLGASLLDPSFAPTDGGAAAVDAATSIAWDDRVALDFPLRGKRVGAGVGAGMIPGSSEAWGSAQVHAIGVVAPHPRVAFAGRGALALARSPAAHRLLLLGGDGGIRSVPTLPACPADGGCLPVATERAVAVLEARTAPLRNASVPGGLAWGSELQVTVGIEGLVARVEGAPVTATGVTVGVLGVAESLGLEPVALGLTAAFRTSSTGLPLPTDAPPQLYLRFEQSF
jgi:hypothetical protein